MAKSKFKTSKVIVHTLQKTFDNFITEKMSMGRSEDTLRNYELSYKIFCDYYNLDTKTKPIAEIEMQMFYQWIQSMKENEVRPQSINHYLRDWRTFMNWAHANGYIEEPLKIKEIKAQEDLPKMYTDEDIMALIEKPRAGDTFVAWRNWAAISIAYATGLRGATLVSLVIDDINLNKGELRITQQKNKKVGYLPITTALSTVLKEYMDRWLSDCSPTDYLLPSTTGEKFNVGALNHSLKKYCEDRGVDPKGIHSVRHNFARDMIKNGAGEYRLQKYLQHSSIQMSQHYVKLFSEDLKQDAETYSPLDQAKKSKSRTSKFKK